MREFLKDLANFILDFIFPKFCFDCGKEGSYLCTDCSNIPYLEYQFCIICNKPSRGGLTHPGCANSVRPDKTLSAFSYQTRSISKMIISGKYYFVPEIFRVLTRLTQIKLSEPPENYVLCPLPLHPRRKRWRGFNQSEIIAQELSKKLNVPTFDCLKRKRNTKTQKDLSQLARIKNVKDAFEAINTEQIKEKHVILIDDVITTGMTLRAGTKVLKKAGARRVTCLTLARD